MPNVKIPSRQVMFNKAVRGLRSQGFRKCVLLPEDPDPTDPNPNIWMQDLQCLYDDGDGSHCAWGWIDKSLTKDEFSDLSGLRSKSIGLACLLDTEDYLWARQLQSIHDFAASPEGMEEDLRDFAKKHHLKFPEATKRKKAKKS